MSIQEKLCAGFDIKGRARVELYEGGRCVCRREADNFIGLPAKRLMLSVCLLPVGYFMSNNGVGRGSFPYWNMFTDFMLTDNTSPVPQTATVFPGNLIGYANATAYTGSDTQRGTLNTAESGFDIQNMVMKFVFDWPTHAANGTFRTVGFGRRTSSYDRITQLCEIANSNTRMCIGGGKAFYNSGSSLYSVDLSTRAIVRYNNLAYSSPRGLAYHDDKIYYTYDEGTRDALYYYDLYSGANTRVTDLAAIGDRGRSLMTDGNTLYTGYYHSSDGYRIYNYSFNGTLLRYANLSDSTFAESNCNICNPGWIMRRDGRELNISDLFDNGVENVRRIVDFSDSGLIAKHDSAYYKVTRAQIFRITESTSDSGLCQNEYDVFGQVEEPETLGTCVVLDSPVTKQNTQNMKITYTLNIVLP